MSPSIKRFQVGINTKVVGKCDAQKLSYSGAFKPALFTEVELAAHISSGYPWMPALLGGNGQRWASNVISADLMALDFDGGTNIEQALADPFISAHAGLLIESSSSTPNHHKFRVVFRLPETVKGSQAVGIVTRYLLSLFPQADQACKDASRFYFGAVGREARLINEGATLPATFEQSALHWQAELDRQWEERKAEQAKRWAHVRDAQSPDEQIELVKSALDAIPARQRGDGRHEELVAMIGGICNELGDLGESLLLAWDSGRGQWGRPFERFLKSIARKQGRAGLGTLFHLAKQNGWKRPKRASTHSTDNRAHAQTQTKAKKKQQTKAEWQAEQRIERDRRAHSQLAQMLGIKLDIDYSDDDYAKEARAQLYRPLKKFLKYETQAELIEGFVTEQMAAADGRSLIAYDASKGTGKSNNALIPVALRIANSGGRVLIFVPTRGLAKEFKSRINARVSENIAATHLDEKYYTASIVVTCPESAYKFKGGAFDSILIDECNEVFYRIESGELGNAAEQSLLSFKQLLSKTPTLIIATDEMSGRTLAAAQAMGGFVFDEVKLQRRVRPQTAMEVQEYDNFYLWLLEVIAALQTGKRVSIPTGSQGKGRMIDRILRSLFPNKSGLVIDGRATLANQRTKFLANPDAFLKTQRPDWFIYTPVINSGVSIESSYFNAQFEYITPHEGAQSASQRGERVRSAIGRDGAITERHIYFSAKGAPTLEAYPDSLSADFWRDELEHEAKAPIGAAAALAKALGAEKALKPIEKGLETFAAARPNLPHFLALKAFEIIFKRELLHDEWTRYGWQVRGAIKPDDSQQEEIDALKEKCDRIQIGLIEQQGRTLKKTQTRESEGDIEEINNPFQAARAAKLQLEKLLGKEYLSQQAEEFFTAWAADKSASNPGINTVVRSQLLNIAITDPVSWQQIEQMKALKFLAGKPDADSNLFYHLPELPAAARDIELAGIFSRCPGIPDVVSGKLETWTNQDPQIVAAGLYLITHSKQIAANTRKSGLIRGAKFSEQMAPAALFNKALELMGYKPTKDKRQGTGKRLNVYRLESAADAICAIEDLKAEKQPDPLKLFRAELRVIRAQTRSSINAAAKSQIVNRALAWVSDAMGEQVSKAITAIKARHADLLEKELSKLGDVVKASDDSPPNEGGQMAFAGMNQPSSPPPPPNI